MQVLIILEIADAISCNAGDPGMHFFIGTIPPDGYQIAILVQVDAVFSFHKMRIGAEICFIYHADLSAARRDPAKLVFNAVGNRTDGFLVTSEFSSYEYN